MDKYSPKRRKNTYGYQILTLIKFKSLKETDKWIAVQLQLER